MGAKQKEAKQVASKNVPAAQAADGVTDTVTIANGQKIPVAIPPNLDPAMAKQVIEYLKANPEAAQQSYEQAHRMLRTPGMAQMMLDAKKMQQQQPDRMEKMMQLKDDPELKEVFQDIESSGPTAMEKYWNDTDLMSKIAKKMSALNVGPGTPPRTAESSTSQAAPQTLHEAAKVGDEAALKHLIEEGKDVNATDRRGVTALGVAVGFNRIPCVRCLLDAGADVHLTDARGSTVLHYAAGYGRKEAAEMLLKAGARTDVKNVDEQTPSHVAELNRELHMVEFLAEHSTSKGAKQDDSVFL